MVDHFDEVIPDSQDEGGFGGFELELVREPTPVLEEQPLTNATIPTSSSFVLPRTMPPPEPKSTVTQISIISQFTSTIAHKGDISTISEYSSKDIKALGTSAPSLPNPPNAPKPRPKPRPIVARKSNGDANAVTQSSSIHPPSPQGTYTADIAERIKARRATMSSSSNSHEVANSEAIVISSEEDDTFDPKASKYRQRTSNALSPAKRKRDSEFGSKAVGSMVAGGSSTAENVFDVVPSKPKKKRAKKIVEDEGDVPVERPKKASPAEDDDYDSFDEMPKLKKSTKVAVIGDTGTNGKSKKKKKKDKEGVADKSSARLKEKDATDKDQFKSREFIMDSDDELNLNNGHGRTVQDTTVPIRSYPPAKPIQPNRSRVPVIDLGRMSPLSNLSEDEEPVAKNVVKDKAVPTVIDSVVAKSQKKKRKATAEEVEDKENNIASKSSEGHPPSKKGKRAQETDDSNAEATKALQTSKTWSSEPALADRTLVSRHNDIVVDAENEALSVPTKKRARRAVVEDEDADEEPIAEEAAELKESLAAKQRPAPQAIAMPAKSTDTPKPRLSSAGSLPHPPKNRPLSAILQSMNGSSPKPRASPAVSRSLLSRIAPLHPNRKTPPPPPPRVIPKKTKKEIEREERWEEELQDTILGWCELDESERNRLRKQKRDWELGLLED
ncbi:hypothetical protein M422DRAFT_64953 [Sphaerobolus stellatus SS14]|nr:hypothetical protein M422DRAFT_64953 [Sphaerobolus stellatus SS14]